LGSLNDQKHPYRGSPRGRYPGSALKEVISRSEFLNKMEAVLEARNKMGKDVLIVSRIEARSTPGDEDVIERAKACVTSGVNVILLQARPPQLKFGVRIKDDRATF
jgi:2-methylisocitrate lyase-like PEP mutase family enzyme